MASLKQVGRRYDLEVVVRFEPTTFKLFKELVQFDFSLFMNKAWSRAFYIGFR